MSDESKTIKVHQYAECGAEEARMPTANAFERLPDGRVFFRFGDDCCNNIAPLRYLGVVERPAPPKPKERLRIVFEEVGDFEPDADGLWWNLPDSGVVSAARSCPVADVTPLRRTVERIAVEPEKWEGRHLLQSSSFGWRAVVSVRGGDAALTTANHPTRDLAAADLPILRDLAEQYAAHHGARVEWAEVGNG